MRKNARLVVALLAFGLITVFATPARAQLVAGDVAIVGFWSDDLSATGGFSKAYAFVALTDIAEGTVISFTDDGWFAAGTFRINEGENITSVVPSGGLAAGSVVTMAGIDGSLNLSTSGDQIFAYQGTIDAGSGVFTGTLLYGFHDDDTSAGLWDAESTSASTSALPAALSGASVAVPHFDNYAYTGTTTGTRAELLADINNWENWTGNDDSQPEYPSSFTVNPASVNLLDFSAERTAGGVELAWLTGSELDCGAFGILRCDLSMGDCAEVASHSELAGVSVPCQDDLAGAAYQATDDTADDLTPYSYYLREYETTGGVRNYGPIVVDAVGADDDDDTPPASDPGMDGGSSEAAGCAVSAGQGGSGASLAMLLMLGALIIRRKKEAMKPTPDQEPEAASGTQDRPAAAEPYQPPTIVVRDSDEFIRSLGPAQACSPSPFLY